MPVYFHAEDTCFRLTGITLIKKWICKVIHAHSRLCGDINYIFTSNENIRLINNQFLQHNYFTDVITFEYNTGKRIKGDIYISIDQVEINSKEFGVDFSNELERVIIHGILHLIGFDDKSKLQIADMRFEEEKALDLLKSLRDDRKV